jgi:hypothetical protein
VRLDQTNIEITSQRNMIVKTKKVLTIYNEHGFSAVGAVEYYDKKISVNSVEAIVYAAFGEEIKD